MPTRNQSHILAYRAYNTLAGGLQSGDVGNHSLMWSKDGAASVALTNAPSARATAGWYQVILTASEADCEVGTLIGTSSTTAVLLEGVRVAYDLPVTLTTSALAAVRADGQLVRLAAVQDLYAPAKAGDQMALTSATFNALFSDTDINTLVATLLQSIETQLDVGDLSVQAIAALTSHMTRDAILDRVLAGPHNTAGTPGALLQMIAGLLKAVDYVEPDNDGITNAAEAATSAAAGVVTLQQRLTADRATLMDRLEDLDAPISSRAEPGDAMSLTGTALSFLGGRSIETVNPVGAGGRVDLVIGDDYSSEDGRHLRWIVTGAHASLSTAEIIMAVKQASGAAIEFSGDVSTIDAEQGKYLISVNLDNVDTSELLAGWADYQLVAIINGRRNTQLFGRTQQTPRLV